MFASTAAMGPRRNAVNPELDEVSGRPENFYCADCGAKAPTWASVNLGMLVCIDCSGAHRSLGVHISVVKSSTLDKWQPKWVATVSKIGNRISNEFFEANMPSSARPQQGNLRQIEAFVRAKYERREWVPRGQPSPNELLAQGRNPDAYAAESTAASDHSSSKNTVSPAAASAAASVPAAAPTPALPCVDLLSMDDVVQPTVTVQTTSHQTSAFSFVQTGYSQSLCAAPVQTAPQKPLVDQAVSLTSQLNSLDLGSGNGSVFPSNANAFSFTNAPTPATSGANAVNAAAPAPQEQKLTSFQNSLASLYQQPVNAHEQTQQNRFAALASPAAMPGASPGGLGGFGAGMHVPSSHGFAQMGMKSPGMAMGIGMGMGMVQGTQAATSSGHHFGACSGGPVAAPPMHVPSAPAAASFGVPQSAPSARSPNTSTPPAAAAPGDSFGAIDAFSAFGQLKEMGKPSVACA